MISGLSAFASVLGTELIAEGVESNTQVELLKRLGVSMGQGIFFSKPINAEAFIDFYSKNKIKVEI
jgi:sensor c-di-GMP phosphodiesterase-like protein